MCFHSNAVATNQNPLRRYTPNMFNRAHALAALLVLMPLIGCGSIPRPAPPDLTGNWQIQSGSAPPTGTNVPNAVLLLGALQSSGSQVTGTFRFTNLTQLNCGLNEVIHVTGSVDSKDTLTLTSGKLASGGVVNIHLLTISALGATSAGTIQVSGGSCPYATNVAVGLKVVPVTGSFTGTLEPGSAANPGTTGGGLATLALTQAVNPNSDGQFAVTGSLNFTVGTCAVTSQVAGTISGVGTLLSSAVLVQGKPASAALAASESINGSTLAVEQLLLYPAPCSTATQPPVAFTGNLTRQ